MGPPLEQSRKMQRGESADSVLAQYLASDEPASVASNLNTASSLSTSPRLSNTASDKSAVDGGFVPEGDRYLTNTNAIASVLGLETTPAPAPAPERRPPELLQLLAQQPQHHQQAELARYQQMLQQLLWEQQAHGMHLLQQYQRHLHLLEQTHAEELGATLLPNKAAAFGEYDAARFDQVEPATVAAPPHAAPPPKVLMQVAPRKSATKVSLTAVLTMANIRSIFTEHPFVRRKYLEYVPHKMSKKEFWQRYFSAKVRADAPPVPPAATAATAGASAAAAAGASATATAGVDAEGGLAVSESAPLRGATSKPLDPPSSKAVRLLLISQPDYLRMLQQMHARTRQERQERQERKQRLAQEQQNAQLQQAAPVPHGMFSQIAPADRVGGPELQRLLRDARSFEQKKLITPFGPTETSRTTVAR